MNHKTHLDVYLDGWLKLYRKSLPDLDVLSY